MSVQRWTMQHLVGKVGLTLDADSNGEWVTYADHARIVAEKDDALAAALAEAVSVIEGLADQQAMYDGWYVEPLERLRAAAAAAPRTLTADENYMRGLTDARAAVDAVGRWRSFPDDTLLSRAAVLAAIDALIHDGEATP